MEILRTRLCEWQPVGIDALSVAPKSEEPRLAVGRANGAVELWDMSTFHLHSTSAGHARRSIRSLVWLVEAGGTSWRLFSGGLHKDITEWDLGSLEPLVSVPSGGGAVWAICARSDRAFAACDDGSVRVFSLEGGAGSLSYLTRITVGPARLLSITDLPGIIFAGGSDSRITKWSTARSTCEGKMQVEQAKDAETLVWALVSLGEKSIASGDSLGLVQIWDAVACTLLSRFAAHQADVLALASSPQGNMLLSGGIDRRVLIFTCSGEEEKWGLFNNELESKSDVRAVSLDGLNSDIDGKVYCAGGVAGKLLVSQMWTSGRKKDTKRAWNQGKVAALSGFSPLLQTASVAQSSRLFLCQRNEHLELWYLKRPAKSVIAKAAAAAAPESELVLRIALGDAKEGQHICASALAPEGTLFAASDDSGSRLFRINLEELEVRREQRLSSEVARLVARAMLFCGTNLLALSTWSSHQVVVVGVQQLARIAQFDQHRAAVTLLATAGEWLASGDAAGGLHIFNLDSLEHHAQVPVGQGFPTAIAFSPSGGQLLAALSTHSILLFDVEGRSLSREVPPLQLWKDVAPVFERVCGVASSVGRWLLWTHNTLLSLELFPPSELNESSPTLGVPCGSSMSASESHGRNSRGKVVKALPSWALPQVTPAHSAPTTQVFEGHPLQQERWRAFRGMKHILSFHLLDAAQWGSSLDGCGTDTAGASAEEGLCRPSKRHKGASGVPAMALTFEVSSEACEKALPVPFERKAWIKPK